MNALVLASFFHGMDHRLKNRDFQSETNPPNPLILGG
jgi:hypothetical protein